MCHSQASLKTRFTGSGSALVESACVLHSGRDHHGNGVAQIVQRPQLDSLASWQGISDKLLLARLINLHGHMTVVVAYVWA